MLRSFIALGAKCLILASLCMPVVANTADSAIPGSQSQPMKIIAPFPAGGSADIFARIVAEKMAQNLQRPIIVEPRPGASGIIGTRLVINAAADGQTLLSTSIASVIVAPLLVEPRPFDPLRDLVPITPMANVPAVLVVNPQLGINSFKDFIDYAHRNPGKLNVGNSGTGTLAHLAAELLRRDLDIQITHVAYKGAPPAVSDLLGGHVQAMFSDASFFLEHIKAGKLIALAVAAKERLAELPNIPTTAELGYPQLIAGNVYSLYAPAGTPEATVSRLGDLALQALATPEVRAAYSKRGAMTAGMQPAEFKKLMEAEVKKWLPLAQETASP